MSYLDNFKVLMEDLTEEEQLKLREIAQKIDDHGNEMSFLDSVREMLKILPQEEQEILMKKAQEINDIEDGIKEKNGKSVPTVKRKRKVTSSHVINIDADPDDADWIRIVRAERIAQQVPGGKQIWKSAIEEAGGSRSGALKVFYRLLREAGIEEPE